MARARRGPLRFTGALGRSQVDPRRRRAPPARVGPGSRAPSRLARLAPRVAAGGTASHRPRARRLGYGVGGGELRLEPTQQEVRGLAGITVEADGGLRLSLDRAAGGLSVREQAHGGDERSWTMLGASRGERGILGEGIRQALLRDPTYRPALEFARELIP